MKTIDGKEIKRGDKVKYTKNYMFGKTGTVEAVVVAITGHTALLDNGDKINVY